VDGVVVGRVVVGAGAAPPEVPVPPVVPVPPRP